MLAPILFEVHRYDETSVGADESLRADYVDRRAMQLLSTDSEVSLINVNLRDPRGAPLNTNDGLTVTLMIASLFHQAVSLLCKFSRCGGTCWTALTISTRPTCLLLQLSPRLLTRLILRSLFGRTQWTQTTNNRAIEVSSYTVDFSKIQVQFGIWRQGSGGMSYKTCRLWDWCTRQHLRSWNRKDGFIS